MCCPAYLLFLLVSITNQFVSSQECAETNDNNCSAEKHECLLYLAPSSISGAGFGIFTTRDVPEGEGILPYADAPTLIISDTDYHGMTGEDWAHNSYVWDGGGFADFECKASSEHVMTFGSSCNYHTYLMNVGKHSSGYDDGIVSRFTDPSAGSFSYHNGHHFTASRAIVAGEEIFADYGEQYLDTRGGYADSVPRKDDFIEAGTILTAIKESSLKSAAVINDDVLSVVKGIAKIYSKERVVALVPNTKAEYEAIIQDPLDNYPNVIAKKTIINRDVKWIQDNGLCLDNILPGKSTLPQVGKGAFANRILAKGSMISPVLLLQILNSDSLLMYDKESNELEIGDEPIGKQLITNYCFGHIDSKLLLCPQSNAILINHCSSRKHGDGQCEGQEPNAKVQWANGWDPDTSTWLNMSLKDIERATVENQRGLSFEVIATRDIKKGEEIFIDYGPNWEDAWESHKNSWTPPTEGSGFGKYTPLVNMIGNSSLRTIDELEVNPYPDNIVNACYWYEYNSESFNPDERGYYNGDDYIPGLYDNEEETIENTNFMQRCDLLKKISDTHYEVRIYHGMDESNEVLLTMYPKESITFRMKRYTSDQYLPGAFRHFIEIEDSIFPEQWKTSNM